MFGVGEGRRGRNQAVVETHKTVEKWGNLDVCTIAGEREQCHAISEKRLGPVTYRDELMHGAYSFLKSLFGCPHRLTNRCFPVLIFWLDAHLVIAIRYMHDATAHFATPPPSLPTSCYWLEHLYKACYPTTN